jgi:hypothetical protein
MSKKKNTLKDLDEFLKQQAATLVSPERISEKHPTSEPEVTAPSPAAAKTVSTTSIINDLRLLAASRNIAFKDELYDVVLAALEQERDFSPEDKMLINSILYIKHGSNWKEAIQKYWSNRRP